MNAIRAQNLELQFHSKVYDPGGGFLAKVVVPVVEAPVAVYPKEAEDVGNPNSGFKVGFAYSAHSGREEQIWLCSSRCKLPGGRICMAGDVFCASVVFVFQCSYNTPE